MSIKTYNNNTKQWEKTASVLASGIKVTDLEGKYTSKSVNGCLLEIDNKLKTLKNDVQYIYENGTIGGGGGGGGSSVPIVTIDGDNKVIVNSDTIIDIFYYFTSPNPGNGIVNLSWGNKITKLDISQGRNKWTVGPFTRGKHILSISVEDKQGFYTVPAQVEVISGALELTSTFQDNRDFTLDDNIIIYYEVLTEVPEAVVLSYTYNGVTKTQTANIGMNELNIGKLSFMGISNLTMKVYNSKYESNILRYTLVASDSQSLFMSTTFALDTIQEGKNIQFDYRISMRGQYEFNTDLYIDGLLFAKIKSKPGVNFWNVGTNLQKGIHALKLKTSTVDGIFTKELSVSFEIVAIGYTPYRHVRIGLIAEFDAAGKLNNSMNKNIWEDTSGYEVNCTLVDFNYSSNGWIDNGLLISGKSHAEINLAPFLEGVKDGFTFDMLYKVECVGNIDAKVVSCKSPITPFHGFEVNTYKSILSTKTSEMVATELQNDIWTKVTFVIDRTNKMMLVYVNGVISSISYLEDNDLTLVNYYDEFSYDGKILLGCSKDVDNNYINNSVSEIKNIRIYKRALNHAEVLQNYIADIKDETEQMKVRNLNTDTEGMPTLSFIGNFDMMDENSERTAQISYNDPKNPSKTMLKDNCLISWQGTSSRTYPVKNYTMQLKEGGNPLLTYAPTDDWKPEARWTLKANYMDSSYGNNLGINKFVYDFFKPHPYPCQDIDPTTRGNVDGIPVKLVINGIPAGIYTWNIDRYSPNNYGFSTYNQDGTINRHQTAVSYEIAVNGTSGAAAFWDDSWESIRSEFKSRYSYRGEESVVTETVLSNGTNSKVLKSGMHNELIALISWVKNATDEKFYSELTEHFSKRHLIDYFLITYVFGMVDNLGKNMVLTTWGKNSQGNTIWYPSFYDCDSVMGLNNSGIITFDAGLDMENGDYNTSNSALWVKLNRMFGQEIRERYKELRLPRTVNGVSKPPMFSYENVMSYIGTKVIDVIGQKFYNEDAHIKYINEKSKQWLYLCNGTRKEFTQRWLKERFIYMDSLYEFNYINKSVVRSYAQGTLTLSVKTYSPQWILISFADGTTSKVKKYVGKDKFTTFTMDVNNGTDNNIEIYGCENIMYINGIKDLDVRSMNIAQAVKLVELDISGSSRIEEVSLGNNAYLQKFVCSDCIKLGYQVNNRTLDLSNCKNLRELRCNKTHIANVTFNPVGGVIDILDCSYTDITTFNITGQEYLKNIKLDGCIDLNELIIKDCNGLVSVIIVDTKLSKVSITGCDNLNYLDISQTKSLKILDLAGCPNLITLIMAGVSNPAITDLDLRNSLKLQTLDISSSSYIQTLTFGQYTEDGILKNYNALKNLKCDNSTIKSIRYGTINAAPTYLDLAGLNLNNISFSSCTNIVDVRNINLTATNSSPFNNCYNLVSITGTIKLIGSTSRAFYNCAKLTTLPTLNLSEVTSMSETFYICSSFNMTHVTKILVNSGITNKLTSSYRMFAKCDSIVGVLPANLFNLCTGLTSLSECFVWDAGINGVLSPILLKPMINLTDCYYTFAGTAISGEVPVDFLRYNTKMQSTYRMFYSTKITYAYLDTFFKYCLSLSNAYGTFQDCKLLRVTIPDSLFMFNRELNSVGSMFSGCPLVFGTIPRNLFNNIPRIVGTDKCNLRNVEYFFNETDISGEIPAYISPTENGLLDKLVYLDSIEGLFNNCDGITGSIPTDFLKYNNNIVRANAVFNGCINLSGVIPVDLLKGKRLLTSVSQMFKGCLELVSSIPVGFLNDCVLINNVSELFSGCSNLNGQIPERISTWEDRPYELDPNIMVPTEIVTQYGLFDKCSNLVTASGVFNGCKNLVSEIPPTLLINAGKVTSIDYIFNDCWGLYGPVPENLFVNCRNLVSMVGAFQDCVGLYNYIVDEDNPYALSPNLFKNCFNLTSVNAAFLMWGEVPFGSKLNGQIPADLFINNTKLIDISYFLCSCGKITGDLNSNLFKSNVKLTNAQYAFNGTSITTLGPKLFDTCIKLKDMSYTFNGCTKLTGPAPLYWSETHPVKATSFAACFRGDTGLSNYNSILASWK